MKIAIAVEKNVVTSPVCETAGRSPYYLICENGKLVKEIKNPFAVGGGGAGFGVVHMLAKEGVNTIVAGRFGPNMIDAMNEKNISHEIEVHRTAQEVIEAHKEK